jgi:hypothetical protein
MAITMGMKAERALRLLLGLRNPRIATALAAHGFTDKDRQEGWELLQALGKTRFDSVNVPTDMQTIQALDAWENIWFPITGAALARRYPASHARLFLNLSQTEGPEVALSVRTFLDRYDAMSKGEGAYGPEGVKAAEILNYRGLNAGVLGEARALLAALGQVAPPQVPLSVEEQKAELQHAEDTLWGWYLEWSQVARVAIKQRALLRQLGFLERSGSGTEEETDPVEPEPVTGGPTAPEASTTGVRAN